LAQLWKFSTYATQRSFFKFEILQESIPTLRTDHGVVKFDIYLNSIKVLKTSCGRRTRDVSGGQ